MISGLNEQLQQQLEYTLRLIVTAGELQKKCILDVRTRLQERYAIKFCFKLGKNATWVA